MTKTTKKSTKKTTKEVTTKVVQKIETSDVSGITLDSVKGYAEEKNEIKKFINLLQHCDEYIAKGLSIPKGLILQGPPGCGKTLLAKAIACECKLPFYNFQAENSGEQTLTKIINTFKEAKKHLPAVIYIDEIDKLVGRRYYNSDIVRSLTQYLLTELDGLNTKEGLMLIASTNDYGELPDSLLRSGRMDKRIRINVPDAESRVEILKFYMKPHKQFDKIDLVKLALKIEGLTGADIKTLVNNTLINCIDEKEYCTEDDFLKSVTELNFEDIGRKWKNKRAREDTIVHEVGHSVVSYILTGNHGAINCLKYGNSAGHTSFIQIPNIDDDCVEERPVEVGEEEETSSIPEVYKRFGKKEILDNISIALGGFVAEEYFFGDHFSGCSSDIALAHRLLDTLVSQMWLGCKAFYCRKFASKKVIEIYNKQYRIAKKIIQKNEDLIKYLVEKVKDSGDVISYEQLDKVIADYKK